MSLISKKNKNSKYITFNGKKYALNLDKLKEVCLTPSSEYGAKEMEITQVYEPDTTGDFSISSRVEHETKTNKTPQNDMIIYDIVKLLILSLLENNNIEENFQYDFSTTFALNTLLKWGVAEEINDEE
jgi:hypothetical protein